MRDAGGVGLFVVGVVLIVASMLASCFAPCAWFGCASAKDVPARCVGEMVGGGR